MPSLKAFVYCAENCMLYLSPYKNLITPPLVVVGAMLSVQAVTVAIGVGITAILAKAIPAHRIDIRKRNQQECHWPGTASQTHTACSSKA
jgi:hypothetical protein